MRDVPIEEGCFANLIEICSHFANYSADLSTNKSRGKTAAGRNVGQVSNLSTRPIIQDIIFFAAAERQVGNLSFLLFS
jgi:hypothetical protein